MVEGSSGSTRSYEVQHMAGMGVYATETTTYYHSDHLGSSRLLTSTNGYPTWQATYLPFGQELNSQSTVNNYKFVWMELDSESNLDHTWFRQYSPALGRWCSADPLGPSLRNPQFQPVLLAYQRSLEFR